MATNGSETPFDPTLVKHIKAVSNVFEVGKPTADYSYIEDLGDGRGYTITQYGLCSNEPELAQVIERQALVTPNTRLRRYLPYLPPKGSGTDMSKLAGFEKAWRKELRNGDALVEACEAVADQLYFSPAMQAADETGIKSAVGRLIFYDTILQHGGGDDPDSFGAILKRTFKSAGRPPDVSEAYFLRDFLSHRRSTLMHPANKDTTKVWRESVGRVDALETLLHDNPALSPPILVANDDIKVVVT